MELAIAITIAAAFVFLVCMAICIFAIYRQYLAQKKLNAQLEDVKAELKEAKAYKLIYTVEWWRQSRTNPEIRVYQPSLTLDSWLYIGGIAGLSVKLKDILEFVLHNISMKREEILLIDRDQKKIESICKLLGIYIVFGQDPRSHRDCEPRVYAVIGDMLTH